ncbi:hypothetical protein PFISCL1PPCAC_20462, partial [Pristionchus fissidentatus]
FIEQARFIRNTRNRNDNLLYKKINNIFVDLPNRRLNIAQLRRLVDLVNVRQFTNPYLRIHLSSSLLHCTSLSSRRRSHLVQTRGSELLLQLLKSVLLLPSQQHIDIVGLSSVSPLPSSTTSRTLRFTSECARVDQLLCLPPRCISLITRSIRRSLRDLIRLRLSISNLSGSRSISLRSLYLLDRFSFSQCLQSLLLRFFLCISHLHNALLPLRRYNCHCFEEIGIVVVHLNLRIGHLHRASLKWHGLLIHSLPQWFGCGHLLLLFLLRSECWRGLGRLGHLPCCSCSR